MSHDCKTDGLCRSASVCFLTGCQAEAREGGKNHSADVQALPATVKREGGYAYLLIFGQEVNNWDRDTTYAEVYAKRVNEAAPATTMRQLKSNKD